MSSLIEPAGGWRFAADVGGTFTDIVAIAPDGTTSAAKLPSTPSDYARAVVDGFERLRAELGVPHAAVEVFAHGTTVVTNTILERTGAATALVTTAGFRDVLEIGRMRMPRLYDLDWVKPIPLVERDLRFEVAERCAADGAVVQSLDEVDAEAVIERLRAAKVRAVVVCFLHSYANPAHERRFGRLLAERLPEVDVCLSHEVLAEPGEYERASTAVVNGYVRPVVRDYLHGLADQLAAAGVTAPVRVMQSDGGLVGIGPAARLPVTIVESGPAAGVVAAVRVAVATGHRNALSFDMGGTTAKACLIEDGEVMTATEYAVGAELSAGSRVFRGNGYTVRAPALDIAEVGAGGGSVVWIDPGGLLRVGPRSAGSVPGPVAYDSGGTEPTLTDANIVLGYLGSLVGGAMRIDADAARRAVAERIAGPLGLTTEEAAYGARRVAISTMARALKAVSTERGYDPRARTLVAFGGNGPGHATDLADHLGISTVVVPPLAGVLSAVGLAAARLQRAYGRAVHGLLDQAGAQRAEKAFAEVEAAAVAELEPELRGEERLELHRLVEVHYQRQSSMLHVPVSPGPLDLAAIAEEFGREHDRVFGIRSTAAVEFASVRVVGLVASDPPAPRVVPEAEPKATASRRAYFGAERGWLDVDVLTASGQIGARRRGPFILEQADSTTLVGPGWSAYLDDGGNIVMERDR